MFLSSEQSLISLLLLILLERIIVCLEHVISNIVLVSNLPAVCLRRVTVGFGGGLSSSVNEEDGDESEENMRGSSFFFAGRFDFVAEIVS